MDKYFLVNVQQDASPDWRAVVRAATAEQAAEAAIAAWEGADNGIALKSAIYSDLKKLDAHIVRPHEYDEAPELTHEQLAAADVRENGKLVRKACDQPRK